MMGVDLTAIPTIGPGTALVIASEIGPDFSAFPSAQHFCSWLALAPGTRISGGKNLPGKSPKAVNPVGQALRMAAMAARRSETFIGAKHRARLARMDTPVAIKATARELACLIYLMVTEGQEYVEQGIGAYEKRRLNRKFAPCLSGCHIHPLDIGCVSSMDRDSWTFSTAPTCNSLSPFPSFSGFFQMTRPVPPTWKGLAGAMGSPARTAASWANLTASPRGRAC